MSASVGFPRYRVGLSIVDLYPMRTDGLCRCDCGNPVLHPKRSWASPACLDAALFRFWIVKGDVAVIRWALTERDGGKCARCGQTFPPQFWEAHHKIPVSEGGGGCDLDGFDTLCVACHDLEHAPLAGDTVPGTEGETNG